MSTETVELRILNQIGQYNPGQIVKVSKAEAEALCAVRSRHNGKEVVRWQGAMPVAEIEKLKKLTIDKGGLTQDELEAMGMKNVVPTPVDKAFEKRLKKIQDGTLGEEDVDTTKGKKAAKNEDLAG